MVYLLLIILYVICLISYFEEELGDNKWYVYWGVGVVLILMAAFRPLGIDNDSETYDMYFANYDTPLYEGFVEFSFLFLAEIFYNTFGDVHSIFLFYALFGVSLKFVAIRRLTPLAFLAVAIYLGHYYILHELTQIRAGIASGFFLLSIKPLAEGRRLAAAAYMAAALFFHYSSAVLFPLLLLSNKEMTQKVRLCWASIVPVGFLMYFLHLGISTIPLPFIGEKLELYDMLKEEGTFDEINVFNAVFLVKNVMFLYFLYMYDTVKSENPYFPLMLKIMGLSIFSYLALSSIPIVAMRVSELLGIVDIILFTCLYYTVRPSWLSRAMVLSISLVYLYLNLFHEPILKID